MKKSALTVVLLFGSACSVFVPAVKPLPPAAVRDPALEREAMRVVGASGVNADPIYARVVSPFRVEQNELTGAPTKRYIDIAVVVRSRVLDNTCSWGTHRYSQRHAGGGSYEGVLTSELLVDSGRIDCDSPELKEEQTSASQANPSSAEGTPVPAELAAPATAVDPAESEREVEKLLSGLDSSTPPDCKRFAERSCRNPAMPEGNRVAACNGYIQMVRQLMTQGAVQAGSACKNLLGENPR